MRGLCEGALQSQGSICKGLHVRKRFKDGTQAHIVSCPSANLWILNKEGGGKKKGRRILKRRKEGGGEAWREEELYI